MNFLEFYFGFVDTPTITEVVHTTFVHHSLGFQFFCILESMILGLYFLFMATPKTILKFKLIKVYNITLEKKGVSYLKNFIVEVLFFTFLIMSTLWLVKEKIFPILLLIPFLRLLVRITLISTKDIKNENLQKIAILVSLISSIYGAFTFILK